MPCICGTLSVLAGLPVSTSLYPPVAVPFNRSIQEIDVQIHPDMDPEKQLIISLAVDEGHDADIPTNEGLVRTKDDPSSPTTVASSEFDKDIEKDAVSDHASNITSRAGSTIQPHEPEQSEVDPNIVDWDGPDDPENPMNWAPSRKWGAIAVVSGITFLTPLGSSIFAPGVPLVMEEFNSNSAMLEGFIVSLVSPYGNQHLALFLFMS
jgi:hypothetical protein